MMDRIHMDRKGETTTIAAFGTVFTCKTSSAMNAKAALEAAYRAGQDAKAEEIRRALNVVDPE